MAEASTAGALARFRQGAALVAVAMSLYHLYVAQFGEPVSTVHRPLHLMFALIVLFWSPPKGTSSTGWLRTITDVALIAVVFASTAYLFLNPNITALRIAYVTPLDTVQTLCAIALILVILEASRRTIGWALVIITSVFLLYAYFGSHLPYPFWHRGMTVKAILEQAYLTSEGIWGVPVGVVASYVFLFVLFGSLLMASGAGGFFTDLARALTGRLVGGTAKTSIISSALMGMLSGSSVANVVTTGSFTIPAMRRAGYRPQFAAGVEAVASSGSQLTPPIMGAAAFIMMEFIGVSYASIISAALIPAILYFLALYVTVHLEAKRAGLSVTEAAQLPRLRTVLARQGYLILAIVTMIWLLYQGFTPARAALGAIGSLLILLLIFDATNRRSFISVLLRAMMEAPRLIGPVTVACATGGLIVGVVSQTGLGLRISDIVLMLAGDSLFLTLLLTMVCAVILGMGLPTSGAYIILAALLAPGIVAMDVPMIAAHMFIIYCASKSGITPPVAIASFAAAAVANTDPWRTSLIAFRIGLSIFIIPYMFVYGPALLGEGTPLQIAHAFASAAIGVSLLSAACVGYLWAPMGMISRLVAGGASLILIHAGTGTDLIGLGLAAVLAAHSLYRARREPLTPGARESL
jgi:TRAP transporter 4TM/12TM fusion protein